MIRAWKAFWDGISASLELYAAEIRTGVALVEAVAADGFETELRCVTGNDEAAGEIREGALLLAKAGVVGADYEAIARSLIAFGSWQGGTDHD